MLANPPQLQEPAPTAPTAEAGATGKLSSLPNPIVHPTPSDQLDLALVACLRTFAKRGREIRRLKALQAEYEEIRERLQPYLNDPQPEGGQELNAVKTSA